LLERLPDEDATETFAQIMTIRPIVRYPDPRLALPAQPVTVFDDALRELARDLLETMHAAPGIGITAPHIGVSLRVVVLDLDPVDGARTYVNPEVTWASPETIRQFATAQLREKRTGAEEGHHERSLTHGDGALGCEIEGKEGYDETAQAVDQRT
jgi:hypothetical protein